jgi:hypothetical protein
VPEQGRDRLSARLDGDGRDGQALLLEEPVLLGDFQGDSVRNFQRSNGDMRQLRPLA